MRNSILLLPKDRVYYRNQIREGNMGEPFSMHGEMENKYSILVRESE